MSACACVTLGFTKEFQNCGHPAPRETHTGSLAGVFPAREPSRFKDCVAHCKAQPMRSYCFLPSRADLTFRLTLPASRRAPSTGLLLSARLAGRAESRSRGAPARPAARGAAPSVRAGRYHRAARGCLPSLAADRRAAAATPAPARRGRGRGRGAAFAAGAARSGPERARLPGGLGRGEGPRTAAETAPASGGRAGPPSPPPAAARVVARTMLP